MLGAAAAEAFPVVGASRDLNTHSKMDLPLGGERKRRRKKKWKKKNGKRKELVAFFERGPRKGAPGYTTAVASAAVAATLRTHSILTLIITGKNDGLKCGHSSGTIDIANAA